MSRKPLSVDDYVSGVLAADRAILGRAITLMESNSAKHREIAQEVLRRLLPHTGCSFRLGVTGVPGVGKSTFIETFGCFLLEKGRKVAVLAVDPSSTLSKGSILGDKTRMERLSRSEGAFIRPSPSGGSLGGVGRKSRETILVCEAAGFDTILLETVGVGQSETMVRAMTDFFLLLLLPSAGDEIQGIKRGIMEWTDLLLVNKADGDWVERANLSAGEFSRAMHYFQCATEGWNAQVRTCSAFTGQGIPEVWSLMEEFLRRTTDSGVFHRRRREQSISWMHSLLQEQLHSHFYHHPIVTRLLPSLEKSVLEGKVTPTQAACTLLEAVRF
jgi:LAO/AO transport system kinase